MHSKEIQPEDNSISGIEVVGEAPHRADFSKNVSDKPLEFEKEEDQPEQDDVENKDFDDSFNSDNIDLESEISEATREQRNRLEVSPAVNANHISEEIRQKLARVRAQMPKNEPESEHINSNQSNRT